MNFCAYEGKAGNVSSLAEFAESQTKARGFRTGGSAPFPSHLPARDAACMLLQQEHIWPQQCWQSGDQPSKNQWELGPGSSLGRLRLEAGWEWEIPALLQALSCLLWGTARTCWDPKMMPEGLGRGCRHSAHQQHAIWGLRSRPPLSSSCHLLFATSPCTRVAPREAWDWRLIPRDSSLRDAGALTPPVLAAGAQGLSRQSRAAVNQIGIQFNCRLLSILDACSYKVMENDKYLSLLWQQPFIFPHCHHAFPAQLSVGSV